MSIKIFDIDNKQVVINTNCLLIPELKAVNDEYEDPIPAFSFLYFMTDPSSPYGNLPESAREEIVLEDYPGEYTLEDEVIIAAYTKLKKLYETTTQRIFINAKKNLDNIAEYIGSANVETGRDGNLTEMIRLQLSLGKLMANFKEVQKLHDEEDLTARGMSEIGYDEF